MLGRYLEVKKKERSVSRVNLKKIITSPAIDQNTFGVLQIIVSERSFWK